MANNWDEEKLDPKFEDPTENTALLNASTSHGPLAFWGSRYLRRLERIFGWQLLFLLWVVQHLMKGLSHSMTSKAIPYLFKAFAIDAAQSQVLSGLINLPWAVKPLIGLVSDVLPFMSFRKGPYMAMSTFVGFCAFTFIVNSSELSIVVMVLCLTLIVLQFSTCDILSEAQYASKIQDAPQAGPDLLSYVWAGINIFGLIAMLCSGPLLDSYGYRAAFAFAAVPAAMVVIPVAMGCLQERRLSVEVKWGIPDHWLVLGLSICELMVLQWQWMPQVVLLAALCPPGMEATMLALLAGCHNLGSTVSSHFGAMLLHLWDVKPRGQEGDAAKFENLWLVAVVTSILPLFTAIFLRYLLPDCKQNEKIPGIADPTENSLLRRWLNS